MQLKGTKTEKNLREAFAGESMARNKYTYFASVAKKEGYEQISAIFQKTADNEKEHAKMWFKALGELADTAEISKQLLKAKTMSGLICTLLSLRTQRKRALPSLQQNSEWLPQLKKATRSAILHFFPMLRCRKCLKKLRKPCGNAATADTLL